MENKPTRNYTRLAIATVVAAVIIGTTILDSSTTHTTVTSTSTATSTKTNLATETQTQTTTLIQAVTSTATSTRISTATAMETVTTTATSTTTSTTTSLIQSTATVTAFGTPSIGVVTAANITIGKPNSDFRGVAADYLTDTIYVPGPSNVTVISTDTNQVVGAIAISGGASLVAVNPQTNRIYANSYSCFTTSTSCTQSLYVINGTSNQLIGSINLGQYVNGIDVDYNTNLIYATSLLPGSLYVINGTTDALIAQVSFPGSQQGFDAAAWGVAVNQETNMAYVPTCILSLVCGPDTVYEIDGATGSIVAQIPLTGVAQSGTPLAIAVDSATNTVYMTMPDSLLVSINGRTNADTVNIISALSLGCYGLAVAFVNEIYLSCSAKPDIPSFIVIDGENNAIISSFTQTGSPVGVAIGYGFPRAAIYIVNQDGYVLAVLSTSSVLP